MHWKDTRLAAAERRHAVSVHFRDKLLDLPVSVHSRDKLYGLAVSVHLRDTLLGLPVSVHFRDKLRRTSFCAVCMDGSFNCHLE